MRFDVSQLWFDRASKLTPGASQTGSKAPGRVGPMGAFPLAVAEADGSHVRDLDGNRFIDWFNGNCAVTLGHGDKDVLDSVSRALARYGALPSLPTPIEADVAERLVDAIPCAESVRFVKTGSEATEAAVRIARVVTGRDAIAVIGSQYNGWHSWSVARTDCHPGVPEGYEALLRRFTYNDLPSLERVMDSDVAAILIEPALVESPAAGFLDGCLRIARQHGALLIFDEMITGARYALAGGQEMFGVTPDLATFGKAFANGFPLAFVCGPREFMDAARFVSGTFGGEVSGLAACDAVLKRHRSANFHGETIIEEMRLVGRQLMDGVNGIIARLGLSAAMIGFPAHPVLRWKLSDLPDGEAPYVEALFQQELAARGVLAHPSGWNPSAAHTARDVQDTLHALNGALTAMAGFLADDGSLAQHLRGQLLQPAFARPA